VLTLELVPVLRAAVDRPATSGRVAAAPDRVIGRTIVHAVELPALDDAVLAAPRLTVLASGADDGWRSAMLSLSTDGGATWAAIGPSRGRATVGTIATALAGGPSTLVDRVNTIDVVLAGGDMRLHDADDAALDGGANLAIVGDELIQFATAEPIGRSLWRLAGLWRGRRGTEWASGGARPGARFAMIDPARITTVDLPAGTIGGEVGIMAVGVGDASTPAITVVKVDGRSVAPPATVHVHEVRDGVGEPVLRWTRRSRAGWSWLDRVDTALGEEAERYALSIPDGGDIATTSTPAVAAASLGGIAPGAVEVRQVGTLARSRAARAGG